MIGKLAGRLQVGILVLFAVISVLALSSRTFAEPSTAEVRLSAADGGHLVGLAEGQTLVISLEANPSAGHRWETERVEQGILRQAVGSGRTDLKLVYRHPWRSAAPSGSFSLSVQVAGVLRDAGAAALEPDVGNPRGMGISLGDV